MTTDYPSLFDNVPVGIYRTTPTGRLLEANLALARMLGLASREELLSTDDAASFWLDAREQKRSKMVTQQEESVIGFEYQIPRRDGTAIWVRDTSRTVRDPQGQVLYYEGILEDLSEIKRMEEALRSAEALMEKEKTFFEALIFNIPTAVIVVDLTGQVITWNPAAEKLFGYTQEEAIGRNIDDLVATEAQRAEAIAYSQQSAQGDFVRAITQRGRKDGSLVDVEVLAVPVVVAGERIASLAIYHDITELQLARKQAEAASHAKSAFLANMSHELRTPLNAILGFSELMMRDPNLTPNQRENLEIIGRSGEHLLGLINDVLNLAKIESGRMELNPEAFDLHDSLKGLEAMFRLRAEKKGLALVFEHSPDVPQYVYADQNKLRQVLINLLGNAVKFTEEGGVTLNVSVVDRNPPFDTLHFEIADTGPGIAKEEIAHLFEPFVQTQSGRRSREGTGLGLPISRQFVQLMGGELTVESEIGQGTTFKFDIQVEVVDAAAAQPEKIVRRAIGLEPGQPTYRLLVVDDKEFNRQLLVKLLAPLGFELREAADGQQAIEIWEEWSPHLIWMDMRMPGMDGYQATQFIKSTTRGQATVIVALTASVLDEEQTVILSAGCDDFIRKPFREAEILDCISKHLGVRYVYEEPSGAESPADREALSSQQLAELGVELLEALRQAVVSLDMDLILSLGDRIRSRNPHLANTIVELANNYEYESLSTLIEEALSAQN